MTKSYELFAFKGNECDSLVKHLDYLESHLPQHLNGFLLAFKAFRALEDSCFGSILDPYYRDRIQDFADAYLALGLQITTKVNKHPNMLPYVS